MVSRNETKRNTYRIAQSYDVSGGRKEKDEEKYIVGDAPRRLPV